MVNGADAVKSDNPFKYNLEMYLGMIIHLKHYKSIHMSTSKGRWARGVHHLEGRAACALMNR